MSANLLGSHSTSVPPNPSAKNGNGRLSLVSTPDHSTNQTNRTAPLPGVGAEGVKSPLQKELFEEGRSFVVKANIRDIDDKLESVLEAKARAAAQTLRIENFDPENIDADKITQAKQEELEAQHKVLNQDCDIAKGAMLQADDNASKFPGPKDERPKEPTALVVLCALALAFVVLTTIYEIVKTGDPILDLLIATVLALFLTSCIAKLLFFTPKTKAYESKTSGWLGIGAGFGFAVGVGLLRLAFGGDFRAAVAYAIIEAVIVILFEIAARRHRKAVQAWDEQSEARHQAETAASYKRQRYSDLLNDLRANDEAREAIRAELYHRHLQATNPVAVEEMHVRAYIAGAYQGLYENRAAYNAATRG